MITRIFRGRVHYAWVVAAATFVVLLTAAGFRATPGVLLLPLQHEFGWSPALIGGAVAVNLLVYGLGAPFAAAVVERFGLRRVTVIALTTVAIGAGLTTQMTSPWQLYLLWGLVVGGSTGAVAVPLAAIVANRWFSTRRGLVTGMLTASNASGQLVFLPLLAWVVTAYSWRAAAAVIALTALLVVVPIALVFLRTDPADVGLMPYGAVEPEPPRQLVNPFRNAVGALREAVRVRDFWLLAGAFFICGATTNGLIGTHLIAACSDHGLSEVRGAGLLAVIGVFDMVGTICSGWLTDRFDPRWLLFWYYGLRGISLLGLNAALSHAGLGAGGVRRLLRPGLGGDGAADRCAGARGVRPRAGGRGVRLGVRVPPVRRRLRSLGRRCQPHLVRVVRAGLPGRGRAGRDGGRAQPQRRPPRPAPPDPVTRPGHGCPPPRPRRPARPAAQRRHRHAAADARERPAGPDGGGPRRDHPALGERPHPLHGEARARGADAADGIVGRPDAPLAFTITECGSDEYRGVILLSTERPPGIVEVAYGVHPAARRRGLVTRAIRLVSPWAFRALGAERLEGRTDPENIASQRALERAGFTREGLERGSRSVQGVRKDMICWSLLPSDLH